MRNAHKKEFAAVHEELKKNAMIRRGIEAVEKEDRMARVASVRMTQQQTEEIVKDEENALVELHLELLRNKHKKQFEGVHTELMRNFHFKQGMEAVHVEIAARI